MDLIDIISRSDPPEPWQEGDNIPWNEPGFSARMLKEHLSQAHDAASRRSDKIDQHVAWIHDSVLNGHPTTIVDLGCGPGLYSSRLAALGHTCTGIDFGPASVAYAIEQATARHLACTYRLQDLRTADYGMGAGLVMMIFGELNVFRRSGRRTNPYQSLRRPRRARRPAAGAAHLRLCTPDRQTSADVVCHRLEVCLRKLRISFWPRTSGILKSTPRRRAT